MENRFQPATRAFIKLTKVLAFSAFFFLSVTSGANAGTPVHVINIRAARFAFTPSEITLKQGEPAKLVFVAEDVPHGIVVKGLGIDLELPRHKAEHVFLTPKTIGDFPGECSRYCGNGHDHMKFVVHVRP